MKKNVLISLTSIQWQDDEKNETELLTHASLSKAGSQDVISYEDTSATGFEGSVTTITVDGSSSASIIRQGTANSVLSLEIGRKHYCQYGTPFGDMRIGVYTHAIDNTIEKDGRLYLKYTLDLNSSYLSDNEIIMNIKNYS
ncbi:MAG: DUF1934 domain-containing protein [Ruminococcus sp.]|jgi:uncharacterized beta-barrel protein YwiB (DUF1934 family)|nr:DUF1934 domain-containing protein [Ruminococcus sp.]